VPLQKQPVTINFSQGLSTKTDPFQIQAGQFLGLQNSVFDIGGRLTKRNGFANITNLPDANQTTLTTLNDNLIATGSNLYAFSQDTNQWLNQGLVQPVQLSTLPLVRVQTSQTSPDIAIASTGLTCLTYVDSSASYYQISDSSTGQQIVKRTALPSSAASPRAYLLGQYFIVTYLVTVSGTTHLQYVAIPTSTPTAPKSPVDIATNVATLTSGYDCIVANNNLYVSWAATSTNIDIAYLTSNLVVSSIVTVAGHTANLLSVTADNSASTPVIWITFWDSGSTNMYTMAYSQALVAILAPTMVTSGSFAEISSIATNGIITILFETINDYASPYPTSNVQTDYISGITVTQAGVLSSLTFATAATPTIAAGTTPTTILRSVGLASKPIYQFVYTLVGSPNIQVTSNILPSAGTYTLISQNTYFLVAYGDINHDLSVPSLDQPTYFLIDPTGSIYMRLAYSNGGGYAANQVLPTISFLNGTLYAPYLNNDFLSTQADGVSPGVDKSTNSGIPITAIYTQTGVNLAKFMINSTGQYSSEIAGALHLTGGQLWEYDGVRPVEHGFHVWPDNVVSATATGSGAITAGTYFYQFIYEWVDNQGNTHRSAPSIPVTQVTTTSSSTNTLYVPTLRLTYKVSPNPVRIVGYRWSVAQQIYYRFTNLASPPINNPSVDFIAITDQNSDPDILGNDILYTNGGVIEDIAAPASIASTLFKNRLFLVDAEDQNLLWYSKQVIENTPVEMSDLFTLYVAPTTGVQGSTGPVTALSAMDDKLIIFKKDAIYYLTGTGPDNTGANNDFSDPIFITAAVGCANPNSIVMQPGGLMFQSDKGIWLLGRDLSTSYIGSPVEAFNGDTVQSSNAIPGKNQVRFILDTGMTLMFDYFYNQWGTFTNVNAISSTLYQGYQTYLNKYGQVFQEAPGTYIDGSTPVLISFQTGWLSLAGLRGFERFYFLFMLGTYFSPFKLNVQLAYNFQSGAQQSIMVTPDNAAPYWGDEAVWGSGGPWGGSPEGNVFQARIFPQQQKCQTFQLTVTEIYDSTLGVAAGQGLSLSGMNAVIGVKKGFPTQKASRSFG
jgi:hypothetical protein